MKIWISVRARTYSLAQRSGARFVPLSRTTACSRRLLSWIRTDRCRIVRMLRSLKLAVDPIAATDLIPAYAEQQFITQKLFVLLCTNCARRPLSYWDPSKVSAFHHRGDTESMALKLHRLSCSISVHGREHAHFCSHLFSPLRTLSQLPCARFVHEIRRTHHWQHSIGYRPAIGEPRCVAKGITSRAPSG
jgi:hypothetical protein